MVSGAVGGELIAVEIIHLADPYASAAGMHVNPMVVNFNYPRSAASFYRLHLAGSLFRSL